MSGRNDSFSSITTAKASRILGVNIDRLKTKRFKHLNKVIERIEAAPICLKGAVFDQLSLSLRNRRFPDEDMLEITRSSLFAPVLDLVCDKLSEEFGLKGLDELEILSEVSVSVIGLPSKPLPGRSDYTIGETVKEETSMDEEDEEDEEVKPGKKGR